MEGGSDATTSDLDRDDRWTRGPALAKRIYYDGRPEAVFRSRSRQAGLVDGLKARQSGPQLRYRQGAER